MHESPVERILAGLSESKIVEVKGVRGVGKSSVLREVQKRLSGEGAVFLDLEDPRLSPRPQKETLDLFSMGKSYLLLDEVGRLNEWLDWARTAGRREAIRVVATRSGPAATGPIPEDMLEVSLHPLGLREWLKLAGISVNQKTSRENLPAFLTSTGLPAWGREGLVDLLHRSLFLDVILRHEVRGTERLMAVAVYLLSSTGRPVSATRLKGLLNKSVDQARAFLAHLQDAGLVYLVPRIEDYGRRQAGASRLCFSSDLGMSVLLASHPPALLDLARTAAFHQLLRRGFFVQAWKARGRLGLAVASGGRPSMLVDVSYSTGEADVRPLRAAMSRWNCSRGLLLSEGEEGEIPVPGGTIAIRPLWSWLLDPGL